MHSLFVYAQAYVAAHPFQMVVAICVLVMALVAQLPVRYARTPVVGRFVRFVDRVSFLTHQSAPGTLKWPGVQSILLAAAIDVATDRDLPPPSERVTPTDPTLPTRAMRDRSSGGFASLRALALVAITVLATVPVVAFLHGCASPQQRTPAENTACAIANAGDAHLNSVVDTIVAKIDGGAPVDPGIALAIDLVEAALHAGVPVVCPRARSLSGGDRVRAAIARHVVPQPSSVQ